MYGSGAGLTACTPCSAGYYCPRSPNTLANTMQACPAGTWSPGGTESCHECPAGYECPDTTRPKMNMCLRGYWSQSGQSACTECQAGYTCISAQNVACPTFKWSVRGSQGNGLCNFYAAGMYAAYNDNTFSGSNCDAGSYAKYGDGNTQFSSHTQTCKDCPAGHYCPTPSMAP